MYCTPIEVREAATQMVEGVKSENSPTLVSNETLLDLIERASRIVDLACGAKPEYFEPALYPVWESTHMYTVGEIVTPTTRNSHKYRVITAGVSGASEPIFPTTASATVTSGTVVFTENGADVIASNRTFYGDGTNYLRLDPYVAGSLNTTITLPDGFTAPTFAERDGYLVLAGTNGSISAFAPSVFTFGWQRGVPVTVNALWGHSATPEDIKAATIEMAINLWRETDPAHLSLIGRDGFILREQLPPRVAGITKRYQLKVAEVVCA